MLDIFQFWLIDGTVNGTNTQRQSRAESNGNEGVPHTDQISRTWALPLDAV